MPVSGNPFPPAAKSPSAFIPAIWMKLNITVESGTCSTSLGLKCANGLLQSMHLVSGYAFQHVENWCALALAPKWGGDGGLRLLATTKYRSKSSTIRTLWHVGQSTRHNLQRLCNNHCQPAPVCYCHWASSRCQVRKECLPRVQPTLGGHHHQEQGGGRVI